MWLLLTFIYLVRIRKKFECPHWQTKYTCTCFVFRILLITFHTFLLIVGFQFHPHLPISLHSITKTRVDGHFCGIALWLADLCRYYSLISEYSIIATIDFSRGESTSNYPLFCQLTRISIFVACVES